ncbi:unnamed protein product [Hyaloperonospora brassicae]|uniref:Pseudouridine synthase RsuA/RluA-like domain-containing protein n=1 Tax=Hyaloperonospora brassicae TaxID=162125 RepID=A0AAV0T0I2_HYABA|nr:unnamed protein product [Hyaloperonospora brassicae]
MADDDDPPPPSKKLRRKQAKAQWLAARRAAQVASGTHRSSRKRRNQRQSHVRADVGRWPTVRSRTCSSTTCAHRVAGSACVVRCIDPYVHRFALFAKGRWTGHTLRELFAREFPTLSSAYCAQAVHLGLVRVNGSATRLESVLQSGDFLEHWKHRHEPDVHCPLTGDPQQQQQLIDATALSSTWIHYETSELLVVNKPSGLPVHPSGSYYYNSLVHLLQHERRCEAAAKSSEEAVDRLTLFPVHRLDRLTSGLLLLAKSADSARRLTAELTSCSSVNGSERRVVQKSYVARVTGEFPQDETASTWAHVDGRRSGLVTIEAVDDGFWRVTAAIGLKSPRQGHVRCVTNAPSAKSCVTLLRCRGKAENGQSIVECQLVTGRTHQIRVHLQHLGFPIVNDPVYGPVTTERGRAVADESPAALEVSSVHVEETLSSTGTASPVEDSDREKEERCLRACDICVGAMQEQSGTTEDGDATDGGLWLHSYRYAGRDWSYEVPLPVWAHVHEAETR